MPASRPRLFIIDIPRRIMFIDVRHLNVDVRRLFMRGVINFYDICLVDVHNRYKKKYINLQSVGFSLVLKHEDKSLLLCYNKPDGRTTKLDMYLQLKSIEY